MNTKLLRLPVLTFLLAAVSVVAQPSAGLSAIGAREEVPAARSGLLAAALSETKGAAELITTERAGERKGHEHASAPLMTTSRNPKPVETYSSLDRPEDRNPKELLPSLNLKFEEADVTQVLRLYQELSHRAVVRSGALPSAGISLQSETALNRWEALQALDNVLAANGITMVPLGTRFVKAVPSAQAATEAAPVIEMLPDQLPESSSYMTYIVELKGRRAREVVPALQPFAKMQNSIMVMEDAGILILRDYSANIRRMLQVLDRIERTQKSRAAHGEP